MDNMLNRKKKLYTAVLSAIKVIPFVMAVIYIVAFVKDTSVFFFYRWGLQ